jgi:hypothetical protein
MSKMPLPRDEGLIHWQRQKARRRRAVHDDREPTGVDLPAALQGTLALPPADKARQYE